MPQLLISLLGNVLPDVLKRVLPEKISESEQAQIAQAIQFEMMKQDWQRIEAEFKDRDSARTLAAAEIAKGNEWTSALAALVRPLAGLLCIAAVVYSVVQGVPLEAGAKDIIQTVFEFYFGGRVLEKISPLVAASIAARGSK